MLRVSWDQTREIGPQGLDLVGAVSAGEQSLGREYPWRESYEGHFLYTLLISTLGPEEGFPIPLSLGLGCWEKASAFSLKTEAMVLDMAVPVSTAHIYPGLPLFPPHKGQERWNTKGRTLSIEEGSS